MLKKSYRDHLTYFDIENIVNMYTRGLKVADISQKYKIAPVRVSTILREMNVYHIKPMDKLRSERNIHIIHMFRNGRSIAKIAEDYGMTRQSVYTLIKKTAMKIHTLKDQEVA